MLRKVRTYITCEYATKNEEILLELNDKTSREDPAFKGRVRAAARQRQVIIKENLDLISSYILLLILSFDIDHNTTTETTVSCFCIDLVLKCDLHHKWCYSKGIC